jgi:hypothetical protein
VRTVCGIIGADTWPNWQEQPGRETLTGVPWRCATDQRLVFRLLAAAPNGATEAIPLAHGFTIDMLTVLVRDGLATATPETVHAGKRPIEVVRVRITDAGRLALAG